MAEAFAIGAIALALASLAITTAAHRRSRANRALIEMLMALREYDAARESDDPVRFTVEHAKIAGLSVKLAGEKQTRSAASWVLRASSGFRSAPTETPQSTGGRVA